MYRSEERKRDRKTGEGIREKRWMMGKWKETQVMTLVNGGRWQVEVLMD